MFGRVIVPQAVLDELLVEAAPSSVRSWAANLPDWVSIEETPSPPMPALEKLQKGERAVIRLAESRPEVIIVLLDDKSARNAAADRGLRITGLLGLLVEAAERDLVDLAGAIEQLTKTSFRCSPFLLRSVLERFYR